MLIAQPLQTAIDELSKLPGIGKKTAQRLALHILKSDSANFESLVRSLNDLKSKLRFCERCFNLSEHELCDICTSPKRDKHSICVVEEASDVIAIEKSHEFSGSYHVLGCTFTACGINPDSLKIKELIARFKSEEISEVILALNPDTEGRQLRCILQD